MLSYGVSTTGLGCNALTIFLHSSFLSIHSFIVYHLYFTAYINHLLNDG